MCMSLTIFFATLATRTAQSEAVHTYPIEKQTPHQANATMDVLDQQFDVVVLGTGVVEGLIAA